jgi:hypothetical protein
LFSFGLVVAYPAAVPDASAANFWQWSWEATGRYGGRGATFGISAWDVSADGDTAHSVVTHSLLGRPLMTVHRRYSFDAGDRTRGERDIVHCRFKIECHEFEGAFVKEPKITVASIRGARYVQAADKLGHALGRSMDARLLTDPAVHTHQIPNPRRERVRVTTGLAGWVFACDNARPEEPWTALANEQCGQDLSHLLPSPAYCTAPDGTLNSRWEFVKGRDPRGGLFFHWWEGGYGAPDCGNTWRPWPSGRVFDAYASAERLPRLLLQ